MASCYKKKKPDAPEKGHPAHGKIPAHRLNHRIFWHRLEYRPRSRLRPRYDYRSFGDSSFCPGTNFEALVASAACTQVSSEVRAEKHDATPKKEARHKAGLKRKEGVFKTGLSVRARVFI